MGVFILVRIKKMWSRNSTAETDTILSWSFVPGISALYLSFLLTSLLSSKSSSLPSLKLIQPGMLAILMLYRS